MNIYITIYLACWFFTSFEPIQDGIDIIFERVPNNYLTDKVWIFLGCQYCLTLWVGLWATHNIIIALALSMIAQLHSKLIK